MDASQNKIAIVSATHHSHIEIDNKSQIANIVQGMALPLPSPPFNPSKIHLSPMGNVIVDDQNGKVWMSGDWLGGQWINLNRVVGTKLTNLAIGKGQLIARIKNGKNLGCKGSGSIRNTVASPTAIDPNTNSNLKTNTNIPKTNNLINPSIPNIYAIYTNTSVNMNSNRNMGSTHNIRYKWLLIVWGKSCIDKQKLSGVYRDGQCNDDEIRLRPYQINGKHKHAHQFQAFEILSAQSQSVFQFSSCHPLSNESSLFQILPSKKLLIHGQSTNINSTSHVSHVIALEFPVRLVGVSAGKNHVLAWDEHGSLYSWGYRSLALGYKLLPQEVSFNHIDYVERPRLVEILEGMCIVDAIADGEYSLALTSDGKIYEWGIKKPQMSLTGTQQLIFTAQQIQVYRECARQQNKENLIKQSSNGLHKQRPHMNSNIISNFNASHTHNVNHSNAHSSTRNELSNTQVPMRQREKFISMSGTQGKYLLLGLDSTLYIFGLACKQFTNQKLPSSWRQNVLQPVPVKHTNSQGKRVRQYEMGENIIAIIAGSGTMRGQQRYGKNMKIRVRDRLFFRAKTDVIQSYHGKNKSQRNPHQQNPLRMRTEIQKTNAYQIECRTDFLRSTQDPIAFAMQTNLSKQRYIEQAHNSDQILVSLMKPSLSSIRKSKIKFKLNLPQSQMKVKPSHFMQSLADMRFKTESTHQRSIEIGKLALIQEDINNARKIIKQNEKGKTQRSFVGDQQDKSIDAPDDNNSKMMTTSTQIAVIPKNTAKNAVSTSDKKGSPRMPYHERLLSVKNKRRIIQQAEWESTIRKVEDRSFEHRMQLKMQHQENKRWERMRQHVKTSIGKVFMKHWIIKLVSEPLANARQLKIHNFARTLQLQKLQKNIRDLFVKTRIRLSMNKLHTLHFHSFTLLVMTFHKYVHNFRKRRFLKMRKFAVFSAVKFCLAEKMKIGVATSNFNIRKIQKLSEWLELVKAERVKCMRAVWKSRVLGLMKVADRQSPIVCRDDVSFQSLYREKTVINPQLKLFNYLNKQPIFKLKAEYFQKMFSLFSLRPQSVPIREELNIIDLGLKPRNKRNHIKFLQSPTPDRPSYLMRQADILPFSLHSTILIRNKQFDISIPQVLKSSEKWINEQRQCLNMEINHVIQTHYRDYWIKVREYEKELAHFIKRKYDVLAERRWKYIIQYNKMNRNRQKEKKLKELRRLLNSIGQVKLLDQDIIPEKHAILDQALKMHDAPLKPNPFIKFGVAQFKIAFKRYYESVANRAKQIRKGRY